MQGQCLKRRNHLDFTARIEGDGDFFTGLVVVKFTVEEKGRFGLRGDGEVGNRLVEEAINPGNPGAADHDREHQYHQPGRDGISGTEKLIALTMTT